MTHLRENRMSTVMLLAIGILYKARSLGLEPAEEFLSRLRTASGRQE